MVVVAATGADAKQTSADVIGLQERVGPAGEQHLEDLNAEGVKRGGARIGGIKKQEKHGTWVSKKNNH